MVGLVGNILLGLQLTRLDRYADALVVDAQRLGLAPAPAQTAPAASSDAQRLGLALAPAEPAPVVASGAPPGVARPGLAEATRG